MSPGLRKKAQDAQDAVEIFEIFSFSRADKAFEIFEVFEVFNLLCNLQDELWKFDALWKHPLCTLCVRVKRHATHHRSIVLCTEDW